VCGQNAHLKALPRSNKDNNRIINHVPRWLAESIRKRNGEALLGESAYKEKDPGEGTQVPASWNQSIIQYSCRRSCSLCEGNSFDPFDCSQVRISQDLKLILQAGPGALMSVV
jgi:hypothetical protein